MNAQIINKAGIEQDSGSKVDSDSDGSADSASSIATGSLCASVQVKTAAAKRESMNLQTSQNIGTEVLLAKLEW